MNDAFQSEVSKEAAANWASLTEDSPFAPSSRELERMLFAIESSLQVNRRFQFFLWAQGVLQSFLPHQTLICATGNLAAGDFTLDVFASDSVHHGLDKDAENAARTLVSAALDAWSAGGGQVICRGTDDVERTDALSQAILEEGLGHVMAHGSREFMNSGSFFVFGRMGRKPGRRSASLLESLLPILHFALFRYGQNEASESQGAQTSGPILSDREVQIVQGACLGKTNSEIGFELSISPLTVKNHMQRILKKLEVNNRAQAVAKCISLGIFERKRNS